MRSILTTLDDTPSCVAARTLALALAHRTGAAVQGVTAIDISDIKRVEPAPIGGIQYAHDRLMHQQQQAKARRSRIAELTREFQHACSSGGLAAQCTTLEGDVKAGLLRSIDTCDLAVMGRDAQFHLTPLDGAAPLVEFAMAHGSRPLIVCGPDAIDRGPVLVAYDGSAPAARALQLAVLLGMFDDSPAHILTIQGQREPAREIAQRAQSFLALHDVKAEVEACASTGDPAGILSARASEIGAALLVMGAFGHRGLREVLFGSCTRHLCGSAPLPLFIYH